MLSPAGPGSARHEMALKEKSVQSQQVYNQSTKELTGFDPQLAPPSTSPHFGNWFYQTFASS
jgi:hypothetical protein